MILILASIADPEAPLFAGEFGGKASVLTCDDLVRRPIRLLHPALQDSTISVGDRTVVLREIRAVLNLLPAVLPNELVMYPPAERTYQAAELRALLTYFLSALPCPVVNRATPLHLTGPVQNPAAWLAIAYRLGIPTSRLRAGAGQDPWSCREDSAIEVVSIGGRLVRPSGTVADEHTLKLAGHCRLDYLKAFYRDTGRQLQFLGGDSYPDIRNPRTRAALREHLMEVAA